VTAVDNAALAPALLDSGLVHHVRADGFRYTPRKPVDWMVCDMVEQPNRVARLAAQWLASGWCRQAIFNLKLPMKKRYEEVQRCLAIVHEALAGMNYLLRCKQLYHDREEVTVYVRRNA
jgi:23S rRNA (cytidine2498-2'-O)-methyltransferase